MKATTTLLLLLCAAGTTYAQDTLQYKCSLYSGKQTMLLYESLQLYSNGTFAQTSEYDLYMHQFGRYTKTNDSLTLNVYTKAEDIVGSDYKKAGRVVDSLAQIAAPDQIIKYAIKGEQLQIINPNGNIQNRIIEDSLPKLFGWLFGNRHKYYYRKEPVVMPFNN